MSRLAKELAGLQQLLPLSECSSILVGGHDVGTVRLRNPSSASASSGPTLLPHTLLTLFPLLTLFTISSLPTGARAAPHSCPTLFSHPTLSPLFTLPTQTAIRLWHPSSASAFAPHSCLTIHTIIHTGSHRQRDAVARGDLRPHTPDPHSQPHTLPTLATLFTLFTLLFTQVRIDEENVTLWRAAIFGPEDTPYSAGCFVFDMYFPPNYPSVPPQVRVRPEAAQKLPRSCLEAV
jgi:hypothetical protein